MARRLWEILAAGEELNQEHHKAEQEDHPGSQKLKVGEKSMYENHIKMGVE